MFTTMLIVSAMGLINPAAGWADKNTSWAISGDETLVYNVDNVMYDTYNYWNMTMYDEYNNEEVYNGAIRIDDLMMIGYNHLEDLSNHPNDQSDVWIKSSSTFKDWDYQYDWNVSYGQYPNWDGPAFFMPVITIPQDYLADGTMTDWDSIVTNWNAEAGWTAVISADEFTLTGPADATMNVTTFTATWNINTGIMQYYAVTGTNDGKDYELALTFQYARDESQWGLNWGVSPGLMWAYDITSNASGEIPFGDGSGDYENGNYNNLSDGLFVFMLNEISDVTDHMNWNGSAMTTEWQTYFHFEFHDIGDDDGGPRTWYPIMPIGNQMFYDNITYEFDATGGYVTENDTHYQVVYDDEYGYEMDIKEHLYENHIQEIKKLGWDTSEL